MAGLLNTSQPGRARRRGGASLDCDPTPRGGAGRSVLAQCTTFTGFERGPLLTRQCPAPQFSSRRPSISVAANAAASTAIPDRKLLQYMDGSRMRFLSYSFPFDRGRTKLSDAFTLWLREFSAGTPRSAQGDRGAMPPVYRLAAVSGPESAAIVFHRRCDAKPTVMRLGCRQGHAVARDSGCCFSRGSGFEKPQLGTSGHRKVV
jgi:hypothetical protein